MQNKRHVLTETDLLSIVESTEAELQEACRQLRDTSDKFLDGAFSAGEFDRLVKAGTHKASTILVKDKPAYVVIHAPNAVGWLMVDGAVRIGKASLDHLFEGGYALARHLRAPQIVFVTKLKSLFQYARDHDFTAVGVVLSKAVPQ